MSFLLPVGGATGSPGPTLTFRTSAVSTANKTDYSGDFDGVAIGTAASDRLVIIGCGCDNQLISTVAVGAVSFTQQVEVRSATTGVGVALFSAVVPTGTTADVDIVMSSAAGNCAMSLWTAENGYSSSPTGTASHIDIQALTTNTIDTSGSNGIIIAYSINDDTTAITASWTGLTEQFDEVIEDANKCFHSGAGNLFSTAQTNLTVACTWSDSGINAGLVVVSFDVA